jgi:hypothetical protein
MSTSYSNSLKLALIGTGDQSGTWGTTANTNFGTLLEQAITGVTPINLAGLSAYTLTNYNGTSDDARNAVLVFTGSATGNPTVVTAPLVNKLYTVVNLSTQTVQMTATGGSVSLNIPVNMSTLCYCDASNATGAGSGFYTQVNGTPGTFTANSFSGAGTGLTGTASGLSIGGNAATATSVTSISSSQQLAIIALAYPVGSIYMNTSNSTNPGTLLGIGTWAVVASGQMLLGNGGGYSAGATGGSATTTLSTANLPSHSHSATSTDSGHTHTFTEYGAFAPQSGSSTPVWYGTSTANTGTGFANITTTIGNTGSGTSFSTISPYLVVYMWQRTA